MRSRLIGIAAVLCSAFVNPAQAEWRMFVIANDPGYGVDQCLESGDKCGATAANTYCKKHDYAEADSFRKVDRDDITGAIPDGGSSACRGTKCSIVAIICTR